MLSSFVAFTATMSKVGVVELSPYAIKESGANISGDAAEENACVPLRR